MILLIAGALAAPLVVTLGNPDDPRLQGVVPEDARVISVATFAELFEVVSVTGRALDADCGGEVPLDVWRDTVEEARGWTSALQTSRALSSLAAAEVETGCLDRPPAAADLVRLYLALAEVHSLLAAASDDRDDIESHTSEAQMALGRAAVFGVGLAAPAGFDGALLDAFDSRRADVTEGLTRAPTVLFIGSPARLNGRPIAVEPMPAVSGTNLIQAVEGGRVTAAALTRLSAGSQTVVWVDPGGVAISSGDAVRALAALARGEPSASDTTLLLAAARLVGDVTYAAVGEKAVAVWRPDAGVLAVENTVLGRVRAPVDGWSLAVRVAGVGRYTTREVGPSGASAGLALAADWAAAPTWVFGLTLRPTAVRAAIPEALGGGSTFAATLPALLTARWERADRQLTPVVGVAGGADVGAGVVPVGAVFAGGTVGLGPAGALRAEAWLTLGPGLLSGDISVGTEVRF